MNELSIKYCAPFCRADLRASFHSVWDIWFDPSTSVSVSVFRLGSWNYLSLVILCPVVEKQQLKIHLKSGPCSLIGNFFLDRQRISMQYMLCVGCLFADNLRFTLHLQWNQTLVQERAVISPFFTSLLSTCESELSGKAEPQHWRLRGVRPLVFAKSNICSFN